MDKATKAFADELGTVEVTRTRVPERPDGVMNGKEQIHFLFTVKRGEESYTGFFSAGIGCAWSQWEDKRKRGVPRVTLPHANLKPAQFYGYGKRTVAHCENDNAVARAYRPTKADIVGAMCSDYTSEPFEDWVDSLGWEDAKTAKSVYDACRSESVALERMFGTDLPALLESAREL